MEEHGEPVDLLLEQRPHRLDRDVAPGQTRAARRDDRIDIGVAIQRFSCSRIASTSSRSNARSASTCPAVVNRSTSVSPDVSFSRVRVSDTVSTAMRTGTNALRLVDAACADIMRLSA